MENISEGILEATVGGRPVYMNPAGWRMLGYGSAQEFLQSVPRTHALYRVPRDRDRFLAAMARGDVEWFYTEWLRRDGSALPVALHASLVPQPGGAPHMLATVRDRTAEEREERLKAVAREQAMHLQAVEQANRFKAEFLNMAAHELSNPLTPLRIGIANIVKEASEYGDTHVREAAARLERSVDRLVALVQDLLQVGRIEARTIEFHWRLADVVSLVRDALADMRPVAREAGVDLAETLPTALLAVIDPTRLQQIVANLLSNAVKYTGRGGHVTVRLEQVGDQAVLTVEDSGRGIAAEDLPRLFQPFVRLGDTKSIKGTGLGLYICRGFAGAHGGTIEAASAGAGQGATFTLRIPVAGPPRPDDAAIAKPDAARQASAAGPAVAAAGTDMGKVGGPPGPDAPSSASSGPSAPHTAPGGRTGATTDTDPGDPHA